MSSKKSGNPQVWLNFSKATALEKLNQPQNGLLEVAFSEIFQPVLDSCFLLSVYSHCFVFAVNWLSSLKPLAPLAHRQLKKVVCATHETVSSSRITQLGIVIEVELKWVRA